MADYYYYLGPWRWVVNEEEGGSSGSWMAPENTVGLVDLRPLGDQVLAGTLGSKPYGFFATTQALDSSYALLAKGDCREIVVTTKIKDVWNGLLGYLPNGDKLVDLLWDQLTNGSDVDGITQCCPLNPKYGFLALHLGGHSVVKKEKFVWGQHPHTNKLRQQKQKQFEKYFNDAKNGKLKDKEHHRRILDAWCDEFKTSDWEQFVPQKLKKDVPGRLKHETVISDDFNRDDNPDLGTSSEGWSWTEVSGNFIISGNKAVCSGNDSVARAEIDLSSVNHYSKCTYESTGGLSRDFGVNARCHSSARTYYMFRQEADTGNLQFFKRVSGTFTTLMNVPAPPPSLPFTIRGECNGSDLKLLINGVERLSMTDTSISTGVRTGFRGNGSDMFVDNFEAGDLSSETEVVRSLQLNTESLSTIIPIKQTINEWLNTQSKNNLCLTSWDINLVQTNTIDVDHLASIINEKQISTSWEQAVRQQRQICSDWLTSTLTDSESSIDWFQILVDLEIIPISWRRDSSSDIKIHPKRIWITDINGRVWVAKKRRT